MPVDRAVLASVCFLQVPRNDMEAHREYDVYFPSTVKRNSELIDYLELVADSSAESRTMSECLRIMRTGAFQRNQNIRTSVLNINPVTSCYRGLHPIPHSL